MDLLQALILAVVQGLTEFLPVSSSGHLVLPAALLGWQDQGLAFDVAVHFGSLLAVVLYFRKDIVELLMAWLKSLGSRQATDNSRLAWWVIVGTLPAVILGLLLDDLIEVHLRTAWVLGTTTLVFGILLGFAQRFAADKRCRDLTLAMVLIIGFAQALALVPGTSRSGITITAAAFLGLSLVEASRFSFLLSIPVISGAALLKSLDLFGAGNAIDWAVLLSAMALSGVTAFLCIGWFMRWVERIGLVPFAVYRVLLAAAIFATAYSQL
ncbi:undecaprenyl-diphosphatase [Litorivivens lipolytica]|uniref:Undecaprenyl-diphosphatase n=1 Tax=Litorivivens lipolytica TaxID=1524264 RepID=A0A7W4W216_9GAMM|nr:undecaprenyl-diphosphate phosphatase [Litorivivens lipolytica]MBB3046016.1 undecaprenyl-diphosphatase [Litorivivens lipolytica]